MADVKWIKITTDIFDDEKMLLIESLPDANAIIVVWFKLLCLAGKMNNSGVFMMNDKIAYTDKMLSTIFRMKESTVQLALETFEQFGMIELIDGVITIPNWGKHQNLDQLENRKDFMRNYMKEYREKQKLLTGKSNSKVYSKVYSKPNVNSLEEEREEEKEKINYKQIMDMFNNLCPSFPSLKSLSDSRKKAIKARMRTYSIDDFATLFNKAEASDFLKGSNDRNWSANFDWLIKDANMAKVLDGNYDNRSGSSSSKKNGFSNFDQRKYDMDEMERKLLKRV